MATRVLIADDSSLMRRLIGDFLTGEGFVVNAAKDGREAVELARAQRPDVAILDVRMPVMDGISALRELVSMGVPTIMFSSLTAEDSKVTMEALEIGAFDFMLKPGGMVTLSIDEVKSDLLRKVRAAAISKHIILPRTAVRFKPAKRKSGKPATAAIVVASSTGGPSMVKALVESLRSEIDAAVLIVQHMPPVFTKSFAERLSETSKIPVKEAEDGETIEEGTAYLAPGDYHMEVTNTPIPRVSLNQGPKVNFVRPAADPLFISASRRFGKRTIAVVLSGMGSDGAKGALAVKSSGGYVIAQDEQTSIVYGMPKAVVDCGAADEVLPIGKMGQRVMDLVLKLF
ncbi:MAG: chemotaxis response regulator protein-glutamate methylesterase [Candidatus Methanosuratincola sp.]